MEQLLQGCLIDPIHFHVNNIGISL